MSILHHIVDKHEWIGSVTFKRCVHEPVKRKWLDPEGSGYKELRTPLKKPQMIKDLLEIGEDIHTK